MAAADRGHNFVFIPSKHKDQTVVEKYFFDKCHLNILFVLTCVVSYIGTSSYIHNTAIHTHILRSYI